MVIRGVKMSIFKRIICVLLVAVELCLILTSCSEVEDLIEGEELLPDMSTDDFRDENGVIQWPAEILPEGFPVPDYVEIYSVTREHNVVTVTVFSEFNMSSMINMKTPHIDFSIALSPAGYFMYELMGGSPDMGGYFYNRTNKTRVILYQSEAGVGTFYGEHLEPLIDKSPTGFAMQIIVNKTILQPESLLWDYPDANTDLGLEAMKFDEWPSDYLPENLANPKGQGIDVKLNMEQKSNGVFITVSGNFSETNRFMNLMFKDYARVAYHDGKKYHFVYMDKDGNYIFYEIISNVNGDDASSIKMVERYQICKFNEFVKKGDQ